MARKEKIDVNEAIHEYMSEMSIETDRGAALLAGSIVDNQLGHLLEKNLREDEKSPALNNRIMKRFLDGVLGSFEARTCACFALGLLSFPLHEDICYLRLIRNKFAHSVLLGIDYDEPEVKKWLGRIGNDDDTKVYRNSEGRQRFNMITSVIAAKLKIISQSTERRESPKTWRISVVRAFMLDHYHHDIHIRLASGENVYP